MTYVPSRYWLHMREMKNMYHILQIVSFFFFMKTVGHAPMFY